MAQDAKFIDITKTYLPVDPHTFPSNLHETTRSGSNAYGVPIIPFEGYNFMPTAYGYKSYFGTNGKFNCPEMPASVDKIFIIENDQYKNFIVILTEEGIFLHDGVTLSAWDQVVTLAAPDTHRMWTYTVLNNTLYAYRQNEDTYWTIELDMTVTAVTPTFLTMEGQQGIFKAGNRLGMWDSAGSISWSSLDDHSDFTPSVETLAGAAIFNDVQGKITIIHSCGDGFIIYATSSIIRVDRNLQASFQWDPTVILRAAGVAYREQVCIGSPDTTHYVWSTHGMYRITAGGAESIITEASDYFKELETEGGPLYLQLLENRYLAFKVMDDRPILGAVQYYSNSYEYTYPQDLISLHDIPGNLSDDTISKMYSLGLFTEQQDFVREQIELQTYPAMRNGTVATPTWHIAYSQPGQIVSWNTDGLGNALFPPVSPTQVRTVDLPQSPIDYPLPFQTITVDGFLPSTMHYGADDNGPVETITGEAAMSNFFATQKTYWNSSLTTHRNYWNLLNNSVNFAPSDPDLQPAAHPELFSVVRMMLTDYKDMEFVFGACSGSAKIRFGKAKALIQTRVRVDTQDGGVTYNYVSQVFEKEFRLETSDDFVMQSYITATSWEYEDVDGITRTINTGVCSEEPTVIWTEPDPYYGGVNDGTDTNPWVTNPLDTITTTATLQDGSPDPVYPWFGGAFVYDTELKKWGKLGVAHYQLLDLSPININNGMIVEPRRFGITAAILKDDNYLYRMDDRPVDSYIKYGKIGYFRQGFSDLEEIEINFRTPSTGRIEVESSIDGRNPEIGFSYAASFTDATSAKGYPSLSGRWHTIAITGNYDITYLAYMGQSKSKR